MVVVLAHGAEAGGQAEEARAELLIHWASSLWSHLKLGLISEALFLEYHFPINTVECSDTCNDGPRVS